MLVTGYMGYLYLLNFPLSDHPLGLCRYQWDRLLDPPTLEDVWASN